MVSGKKILISVNSSLRKNSTAFHSKRHGAELHLSSSL
jgi:hypothetical protein